MKAKPGQLKAQWGKAEGMVDLCFVWGSGVGSSDASYLHTVLTSPRYSPSIAKYPDYDTEPSFIQELESRGYDITTLKFSVEKKKV